MAGEILYGSREPCREQPAGSDSGLGSGAVCLEARFTPHPQLPSGVGCCTPCLETSREEERVAKIGIWMRAWIDCLERQSNLNSENLPV